MTSAAPLAVVMPTRNQAGFIAAAVESVFSQGIDGLQLFVQDGASTDGTPALLAELAARHPGLQWASAPDDGPADAVNRALARATAPIVGWLNSDDLYAPGAAARALAAFAAAPDRMMVYGEGEHIDAEGRVLGRYPTRPAHTPLAAWADGCHICQPTAFFRREAVLALGGLDTTLRTAFDYELWLRLLKRHPGRIAHVDAVQARSRLHDGAITLRLRETVALEALRVIRRHIGPAPAHWLLTHFDEVMAGLPDPGATEAPAAQLLRLVERAEADLSSAARATLRTRVATHRGLRLATARLFCDVHADGWAGPTLNLRARLPSPPAAGLRLRGRHAGPQTAPLRLVALRPGSPPLTLDVPRRGPFELRLPLDPGPPGTLQQWQVHCDNPFVPAQHEKGSSDGRALAFLLDSLDLQA